MKRYDQSESGIGYSELQGIYISINQVGMIVELGLPTTVDQLK